MELISDRKTNIFLWIALLFIITLICINSFFGFDYSDEGYSVLLTSKWQGTDGLIVLYGQLIGLINQYVEVGIRELRYIRLSAQLIAAFSFACAVKYFFINYRVNWKDYYLPFIVLGSFTNYMFLYNNLSYNTLSFILCQLLAALGVYLLTSILIVKNKIWIISSVLMGLVTSALFYVKISSAVAFTAMTTALFVLFMALNIRRRPFLFAALIYIATILIILGYLQMLTDHFKPTVLIKSLIAFSTIQPSHSSGLLMASFFTFILLTILFVFTGFRFGDFISKNFIPKFLLLTTFVVVLIPLVTNYPAIHLISYMGAMVLIMIGITIHLGKSTPYKNRFVLATVALFLFGSVIAYFGGTNNPNLYAFTLGSGLLFPVILFSEKLNYIRIFAGAIALMLILALSTTLIVLRYNQPPVYEQLVWVKPPIGRSILLDRGAVMDVEVLRNTLDSLGFQSGDPIFAPFRLPGLVYMLDGYSPGSILWSDDQLQYDLLQMEENFTATCNPCFLISGSSTDAELFLSNTGYTLRDTIPNRSQYLLYTIAGQAAKDP